MLTSITRLPGDHLLSGALLGAMTGIATSYNKNDKKIALNSAIKGGIAGGFSVLAANQVVRHEYAKALFSVALGSGLLIMSEQILNKKEN